VKNIVIVYWSQTGNTEAMAEAVANGAKSSGAEVELLTVANTTAEMLEKADAIALGCPSMGVEVLEETEMEPFVSELESKNISGKPCALFGSYDWGDGQWMRDWQERMEACGVNMVSDGLSIHLTPDSDGIEKCSQLGELLSK